MCAVVKSEFPLRASSANFQKENQRNSPVEHPQVIFCRRFYFHEEQLVYCFHPWCPDGRSGGRREIVCLDCISETVRCRKFILGRDIGWGCRCATSWSDLDLTFDFAVVTLSLKILSRLYLDNHKV